MRKNNRKQRKEKNINREIHVPKAITMMEYASKKQLINCLDKINDAKENGLLSCYILASDHNDLTEENRTKLMDAGYDLRVNHFDHDGSYFIVAVWDQHATGKIILGH